MSEIKPGWYIRTDVNDSMSELEPVILLVRDKPINEVTWHGIFLLSSSFVLSLAIAIGCIWLMRKVGRVVQAPARVKDKENLNEG